MYLVAEFWLLKGIVNADGTPGDAVPTPVILGIDTDTTTLNNQKYVAAEKIFNQFEAVKKLAITILVQSYPSSDYLLEKKVETGAINVEPREAWQYM